MKMAWSEAVDGQWHNADAAMLEATCQDACSSAWTKQARRYVNLVTTDDGLGVNRLRLSHPRPDGTSSTAYRTHPCAGNRFDYCPAPYNRDGVGFNQTYEVNTNDLPEGTTDLNATSTDVTDNDSDRANLPAIRIDRSRPVITLGGRAWEARVREAGSNAESMTSGANYALSVVVQDPYSGVAQVSVLVDGQPLGSDWRRNNSCAGDGCSQSETFLIQGSKYATGDHVVEVRANDSVGNPSAVERFTFYARADPAAPARGMFKGDGSPEGQDDPTPTVSTGPEMTDQPCAAGDPDCAPEDPSNEAALEAMEEPGGTRMTWPRALVPASGLRVGADINGVSGANFWAMSNQAVNYRCEPMVTNINQLSAEQRETALDRTQFKELRVRQVRYILPYDAIRAMDPNNPDAVLASADDIEKCQWLRWRIYRASAARVVGIKQVMVSMAQRMARAGNAEPTDLPSPTEYRNLMIKFRQAHLDIRRYSAWNEPDIVKATASRLVDAATGRSGPEFAAIYWRRLNRLCTNPDRPQIEKDMPCTVAAWDATDRKWNQEPDVQRGYFEEYLKHLNGRPSVWSIHSYGSNFHGSLGRLRGFLQATHKVRNNSKVWITEGGAVVRINNVFRQLPEEARIAFRTSVNRLIDDPQYDRITRFYYHTLGGDPVKTRSADDVEQPGAPNRDQVSIFDTGLLSPYNLDAKREVFCDYQRRNNPDGAAGCVRAATY